MKLMAFQKEAVDKLSKSFFKLWNTQQSQLPLVFKAPTGAGKTIMMAEFLRTLDSNYHFDEDKAYLWISFGGDNSYMQSKNKLYKYFNEGTDMALKDKGDLSQKELYKNNIFFINWSKIKSSTKDGKVLRKDNELTFGNYGIFDEYIKNTKKKRDLVLIIDEAHTETNTTLASEVIDLIDPRIIIKVTATPKNIPNQDDIEDGSAGYVRVKEKDVIDSGLIKNGIIIQTQEEIKSIESGSLSEDEIMIELAIRRREELLKIYQNLKLDINPLILIQLPSDMIDKEEVSANKKTITLNYLKSKGVSEDKIAIWLSDEKTDNLNLIELNNSDVDFILFKTAPATGWDCPRASILVMFREIKTPSFHTQIIGRVKRMPEAKHYDNSILNKAYIYTNYNKSHIQDIKEKTENKIPCFTSIIKPKIEQIRLESVYHNRVDFNTLTPEDKWQKHMINMLNKNRDLIISKLDMEVTSIENKIVVDTTINSFDNFIVQLKSNANETDFNFSRNDIEKLYNLLCFEELQKQDIELAKYNPSRSWSALKKALNVWFNKKLALHKENFYLIIVNDMLKNGTNSILRQIIHESLVSFREVFEQQTQSKDDKKVVDVLIPPNEISFTDDYELMETNKNVYNIFYNKKEYKGKINEEKFISFIETQNIEWWHKQSDSGKDTFAIEYFDSQENKNRLFYPDFIIKMKDTLYIVDTKQDATAKSLETKAKSESLQKWIKNNNNKYNLNIIGGIVIYKHPYWKLNSKQEYIYENESDWINFL